MREGMILAPEHDKPAVNGVVVSPEYLKGEISGIKAFIHLPDVLIENVRQPAQENEDDDSEQHY